MRKTLRQLGKVYDPLALCVGYRKLGVKAEACDHTFKHTRAVLCRFAPDVDADAYIALLAETVGKPALVTHEVEKILGRPAESFADAVSAHRDLFTNHQGRNNV